MTWDLLPPVLSAIASSAGAVWVARRAIDHALKTALADRRASFELSLEAKREAFTKDLETERQAAQLALEGFKTQLTLAAEVRRQAAALKVQALLRIANIIDGEPTLKSRTLGRTDNWLAGVNEYGTELRKAEILLTDDSRKELWAFHALLMHEGENARNDHLAVRGVQVDVWAMSERYENARSSILTLIRCELQAEPL